MRLWKWIGVAGVAGVAATGVVVARNERQRRAYSPDDVRTRLHERAETIDSPPPAAAGESASGGRRERFRHFFRRPRADGDVQ
ncbi:MAG: hypothetical protein ABJD68_20065 [Nakamurella sp.]